jgi:uncharacterized protein
LEVTVSVSDEKDPTFNRASKITLLRLLLLTFTFLCLVNGCRPSSADPPASLNGRWTGSGTHRGRTMPAVIDFYETPGGWRAFGGRAGLPGYFLTPVRKIRYQPPHLSFEISDGPEHLSFEGTVSGKAIKVVSRGQEQVVIELQWTGDAPPLLFTEEAIEIRNGDVKLGGDLLLPSGPGPHPALVLIHGSGRATRDNLRIFGNLFVSHSIAVLLYDKRDVGPDPSGADLGDARDLAGDALAAVALLKARDDIRKDQIGLWGASQGGTVAAMAAAQSSDVVFIIGVSAPGVSIAELYLFQVPHRFRRRGFSDREVSEVTAAQRRLDDFIRRGNPQGAQTMLEVARRQRWFEFSALPAAVPTETELRSLQRWRNLDLDPVSYWERVKVPVLLIYGEREDKVPVDRSIKRIREAFRRAGNTKYATKIFPGADHSLNLTPDAGAGEQRSVEANEGPRFAPGYLDTMTGWLRKQLGPHQ